MFRFRRLCFGLNSSPFLLNAVLRHHIETYKASDPEFSSKLIESFYVDDLVSGCRNADEAFTLYQKASERMKEGGFRLRKWKTNDATLAEKIEKSESKKVEIKKEESDENTYAKETLGQSNSTGGKCKVLGMAWDNKEDTL